MKAQTISLCRGKRAQQQPYGLSDFIAGHTYAYDAAGRETSDTETCGSSPEGTATRTYDSDNHISTQNIPQLFDPGFTCAATANQTALSYTWAADGHLANFTNTQYVSGTPYTNNYSAHWDGDDLLYVASGGAIYLYVEKLAVMLGPNNGSWTTMVYDRDWSGTSVNSHFWNGGSTYGFGFLTADNVHTFLAQCKGYSPTLGSGGTCSEQQNPPAPSVGGPAPGTNSQTWTGGKPTLDASREDGYFDGSVSFQGVRAYDPNMNQWTTPDAYSGDVHDPMSQHPYMWNANNPVQYSDPSGYVACTSALGCVVDVGEQVARDATRVAGAILGGAADVIAGAVSVGIMAGAPISAGEGEKPYLDSSRVEKLPRSGDVQYYPPKHVKGGELPRDRKGGIVDRNGNSWRWDPKKSEWDVQHPDGSHTNVNADGDVTHGENKFPKGSKNNPGSSSSGQGDGPAN